MPQSAQIVLCTVPNESTAESLAKALVEAGLAACVNIVPAVRSIYRYQGKIEDDRELMLVIKTQALRYAELEQCIRALHPYQVPEVLAFDVAQGSAAYLAWLMAETEAR